MTVKHKKSTGRPSEKTNRKWWFYTSGGEIIGHLTYTKKELRVLFPEARIDKDNVYL